MPLLYALVETCVKLPTALPVPGFTYLSLQSHKNEECAVSGQELCFVQKCREACVCGCINTGSLYLAGQRLADHVVSFFLLLLAKEE